MECIFDQFGGTQIFVISHERALDSFVTNVYTFTKRNHETSVHLEKMGG